MEGFSFDVEENKKADKAAQSVFDTMMQNLDAFKKEKEKYRGKIQDNISLQAGEIIASTANSINELKKIIECQFGIYIATAKIVEEIEKKEL